MNESVRRISLHLQIISQKNKENIRNAQNVLRTRNFENENNVAIIKPKESGFTINTDQILKLYNKCYRQSALDEKLIMESNLRTLKNLSEDILKIIN